MASRGRHALLESRPRGDRRTKLVGRKFIRIVVSAGYGTFWRFGDTAVANRVFGRPVITYRMNAVRPVSELKMITITPTRRIAQSLYAGRAIRTYINKTALEYRRKLYGYVSEVIRAIVSGFSIVPGIMTK